MYVTFVIKLIIWQCHIRHQNSMSQNIRSGHKRLTQRFLHYTIHDENIIVTWWFMMISTVTNTSSNLTSHRQFVMKLVLYDALTNYTWCWVSSQNSTLYDAAFGSSQKVTTLRDDFKNHHAQTLCDLRFMMTRMTPNFCHKRKFMMKFVLYMTISSCHRKSFFCSEHLWDWFS